MSQPEDDGRRGGGEATRAVTTPLVAIVLAAGVGSRLRPYTDDRPKCLVSLGRETILHRAVRVLAACGVGRLIVSTGYRADAVHAALADAPVPVAYVHNPDYERTQNVVSLARAMAAVRPGERVIKLDGDVVFEPVVIAALLARDAPGVVAVERARAGEPLGPEPMKVSLDPASGRVRRFGKGLRPETASGESIGIECFAPDAAPRVAQALTAAVASGRTGVYYEDVYNDVLDAVAMVVEPVDPSAWFEIDDADDLARARARFG